MKIEDMRERVVYQFQDVEFGDVFQPEHLLSNGFIYLKTNTIEDNSGREFNCLCLDNGYMTYISREEYVVVLDAKVVIE